MSLMREYFQFYRLNVDSFLLSQLTTTTTSEHFALSFETSGSTSRQAKDQTEQTEQI